MNKSQNSMILTQNNLTKGALASLAVKCILLIFVHVPLLSVVPL